MSLDALAAKTRFDGTRALSATAVQIVYYVDDSLNSEDASRATLDFEEHFIDACWDDFSSESVDAYCVASSSYKQLSDGEIDKNSIFVSSAMGVMVVYVTCLLFRFDAVRSRALLGGTIVAAAEGDGAGRAHDRPREPVDPRRHGPRAVPAQRVVAPEPDHGRRLLRRASAASAASRQLRTPRPQDFSAHIAYACAHNVRRGDDVQRAVRGALEDLGASVLNGGLSTLLAVTVLAFSDYYAYFQMFIMFLAMVLSGLLHGLVLLPALFLILF